MAGYIGSKAAVTQVDGYTKSEADARYVEGDDTLYVDQTNNRVGIGTSSPDALGHIYSGASGVTNPHSYTCLLYTSPSPRDVEESRMPSSA